MMLERAVEEEYRPRVRAELQRRVEEIAETTQSLAPGCPLRAVDAPQGYAIRVLAGSFATFPGAGYALSLRRLRGYNPVASARGFRASVRSAHEHRRSPLSPARIAGSSERKPSAKAASIRIA
jgi:hypothetical protein